MRRAFAVVVCLVLVVSAVGIAAAQTGFGTFETPLDEEPVWNTKTESGNANTFVARSNTTGVVAGNWSMELAAEYDGDSSHAIAESAGTGVLDSNDAFTITFYVRSSVANNNRWTLSINDTGTDPEGAILVQNYDFDGFGFRVAGGKVTSDGYVGGDWNKESQQYYVELTTAAGDDTLTATIREDGPHGTVQQTATGTLNEDLNLTKTTAVIRFSDFTGGTDTVYFDQLEGLDPEQAVAEDQLKLDTGPYMEHDSTQPYTVYHLEVDPETGKVLTSTDVSDTANVSSGDTSLVNVDEANHQLFSTVDVTRSGTSTITANYTVGGEVIEDTQDVTVANKTLDNIGILPPPTWLSATFGAPGDTTGSSDAWPGAIQLQWLFVCLVVGAIVSWKSGHAMIGVGVAEVMLAFGWAIAWVSDGVLIASIIFVVYAALAIGDVASGGMAKS